ncbi:MAG: hypothetical protein ACRERE_19035 [Candidatus Entotheonellia bacterium]
MFVDWRVGGGYSSVGYAAFALGALYSLVNFYLSFVRPYVLRALVSDQASVRNVSGIPLLGMLTVPALAFVPPSVGLSIACLGLILADTGNVLWFVVAVWRDKSFWKAG